MGISSLLIDEYFAQADARFLDAVRQMTAPRDLAALAERWKKDARPWARAQLFAYLRLPMTVPGHQVLVKRVLKHAEEAGDDELMAHLMRAFDGLVRRVRRAAVHYDRAMRVYVEEERLVAPHNQMMGAASKEKRKRFGKINPQTGAPMHDWVPRGAVLFTYHTRYYLRRRAWRYFRRMGFQRAAEFAPAVARALAIYADRDLADGANILDSWALVNALFRWHPALKVTPNEIKLNEGRALSELAPAPTHGKLWAAPAAVPSLLALVASARARLVRVWAMRMLRDQHAERLSGMAPADLLRLLDHDDPEVQRFGAELLQAARDLNKLPVESWLRLLATRNLDALELLAAAVRKHVRLERFSLEQALGLATSTAAPVAALGFEALKTRPLPAADRSQLAALANAACEALAGDIAAWALAQISPAEAYDRGVATALLDARNRTVRDAAWRWLSGGGAQAAYADSTLWSRLIESPYDDLRLGLVELLSARAARPAVAGDLAPVWTATLLAVHRGGRQKSRAVQQLRQALEADPARAETLLPVLAVAIRSVRATERDAGLAAVLGLLAARPELAELVRRVLPELEVVP